MAATAAGGPSTTAQHALDALRRAIVAGELRPGARVGQDEFAQQLGVSIAPVREALRILEQEGQVTYLPRRGYFVTALEIADLEEIYGLRAVLEGRAARNALASLDEPELERIALAARDFVNAVDGADVAAELEANRRFHLAILDSPDHPHTMRVIRQLWDSTEAYRALYYNLADERRSAVVAHDRILAALRERDAEQLVAELAAHRDRALTVLRQVLAPPS
jgi:DNA-binding GntR family transcriptional regulator